MATVGRALKRNRYGQAAVVAAAFLVLALGFCQVARDFCGMDAHGMSVDACASVVMVASAAILLAGLVVNGWSLPDTGPHDYAVPIALLDPPPKASYFS